MSLLRFAVLLICLVLAGCQPGSQRPADEQKEPYFLRAKKLLQERDYQGAIDYFEKTLDVNPRNASAHFELGILYEQQQADFSAALYHYQKAINMRPDFPAADIIRQHIEQCKRELAKSVVQLPSVEVLQRKVDALTAENLLLKQQLQTWQNYYAGRGVTVVSNTVFVPSQTPAPRAPAPQPVAPQPVAVATNPPSRLTTPVPNSSRPQTTSARSHVVAAGENFGSIARKYNLRVAQLQAANPSVDARRLRPGQLIMVPASSQ